MVQVGWSNKESESRDKSSKLTVWWRKTTTRAKLVRTLLCVRERRHHGHQKHVTNEHQRCDQLTHLEAENEDYTGVTIPSNHSIRY